MGKREDLIKALSAFKNVKSARGKGLYDFWDLDYPVDFICYAPDEFEKQRKRISLASTALKEGVRIV